MGEEEDMNFNLTYMLDFGPEEEEGGGGLPGMTSPYGGANRSLGNHSLFLFGDDLELRFQEVIYNLNKYVLPLIILIGIVGNAVSFVVYVATPRLSRQSSSLYLAFLAMVDNVSLVSIFVVWFGWVGIHIFHKNGWCQTIQYCTYVCSFLSAWTVVSFTCERWIVVFHPLRRHQLCTRRRALAVMTSLTLAALLFYSFSLFTTSVHNHRGMQVCIERTQHPVPMQVVRSIDNVLSVVVPLFSIFIMNAGIGIKICHYTGRRKTMGQQPDPSELCSNYSTVPPRTNNPPLARTRASQTGGPNQAPATSTVFGPSNSGSGAVGASRGGWRVLTRKQHTQVRITRALLVVSTVFIALNLPSYAFRIHAFVISLRKESYRFSLQSYIWQEFIQFLYYSNFSSRFFLYSACSRNFRCALCRLMCRRKRDDRK